MSQRDRAAVDVDDLLVEAEHPRRVARDGGEGLVDLDAGQVGGRVAGLLQGQRAGLGRRASEVGELARDRCVPDDRREDVEAVGARVLLRAHDDARGAVVDGGRVAGGGRPFQVEDRLQGCELLDGGVAADRLVLLELAGRDDLLREAPAS